MRAAAILFLWVVSCTAFACQETCVEHKVGSRNGRLLDAGSLKPIFGATLVIRDMKTGPKTFCSGRKGRIVASLSTRSDGSFSLKKLAPGRYWITYDAGERSESFAVTLEPTQAAKPFDLTVDGYVGSLCYVPDIERNTTKPAGWPLPVEQNN
jgi:hypothetical protein